jgi:RimJ/RimL family protein N-acetyltransferase
MATIVAAAALHTPRLRSRALAQADGNGCASMCADAEFMRGIRNGQGPKPEEAWRGIAMFLGHEPLRGCGTGALEHRGSGPPPGCAGFHHPPDRPGFEFGGLPGRGHWGRGCAREAAARVHEARA